MSANGKPVAGVGFQGQGGRSISATAIAPNVCPATLANLTDMAAKVGSPDVRILFVPWTPSAIPIRCWPITPRPSPPQVVGLRGTENQLAALARAYRVRLHREQRAALRGDALQCGVLL